ncbi:hypothetical protein BJY16_006641 [Actinoplanes octamycinicus]|uniref:DUF4352 domain-containing protein n=1 Tax=Actinoplanes octamycinicus TaxID=135948 RepID=A0A7W7H3V9_9ACTN|nr:hypothetical protein [Actinoplanes octamycinicus]MBB4743182.1 hypothetical protein [Actinoplanes octamycinicus]GIE61255.1 hypothetical protein Aoc01nite_66570 [Actinoplanes octamycinicus]
MRKARIGGVAAAALIGAGLALATGGAPAGGPHPAVPVLTAGLGTPVTQEGVFEYTVRSFACRIDCRLDITVRNLGTTAREPGIAFARIYDSAGIAHLPDAMAQIRADGSGPSLLDELAPGAVITSQLVYPVPDGPPVTSVVLRESPSAAGIRIALPSHT